MGAKGSKARSVDITTATTDADKAPEETFQKKDTEGTENGTAEGPAEDQPVKAEEEKVDEPAPAPAEDCATIEKVEESEKENDKTQEKVEKEKEKGKGKDKSQEKTDKNEKKKDKHKDEDKKEKKKEKKRTFSILSSKKSKKTKNEAANGDIEGGAAKDKDAENAPVEAKSETSEVAAAAEPKEGEKPAETSAELPQDAEETVKAVASTKEEAKDESTDKPKEVDAAEVKPAQAVEKEEASPAPIKVESTQQVLSSEPTVVATSEPSKEVVVLEPTLVVASVEKAQPIPEPEPIVEVHAPVPEPAKELASDIKSVGEPDEPKEEASLVPETIITEVPVITPEPAKEAEKGLDSSLDDGAIPPPLPDTAPPQQEKEEAIEAADDQMANLLPEPKVIIQAATPEPEDETFVPPPPEVAPPVAVENHCSVLEEDDVDEIQDQTEVVHAPVNFAEPGEDRVSSQVIENGEIEEEHIEKSAFHHTIPTTIKWEHGGTEVSITESFHSWKTPVQLTESDGIFSVAMDLPEGQHYCKFLVDGNWTVNNSLPVLELEQHGQVNEIVVRIGNSEE